MEVEVTQHQSPADDSTYIAAKFSNVTLMLERMAGAIYKIICERIAERYVQENYPAIAAKLDQEAIANLAIAESAKKIAEEIKLRPVIVKEVEREVYQRGIFGGMRRVR